MDSISQAALGAAVAATVVPEKLRKRAMVTGAVLGTLPDLDVLIRHAKDIDNFTYHRSFSHSILLLPLLALLLLPLLRRWYATLSWGRLYMLIVLALVTHPLLDALTAYGTQLFYPLQAPPTFISSVFILDPLYTVWLLIGIVVYGFCARGWWVNTGGLIISTLYLVFGIGMQTVAKNQLIAAYPNTKPNQWFVGALNASPFCWHGIHKGENHYIETAFNVRDPSYMAIREYTILPPSAYPSSTTLDRLRWFNPNTVLRQRDGRFISSDLRMGEFGLYSFEFIIDVKNSGKRLDMFDKPKWQSIKENAVATAYAKRNADLSVPQQKWLQFMRCLGGGI